MAGTLNETPLCSTPMVLVTVGSTKFDALIRAVDTQEFAATLRERGYKRLVVQKGAGTYTPQVIMPRKGASEFTMENGLSVELFDFRPNLADLMSAAALVISHAGSGSIFEALTNRKALIVVPNPALMDNHQAELAEHLATLEYLACSTPEGLPQAVRSLDPAALKPYPQGAGGGAAAIVGQIDQLMGFAAAASS